MPEPLTDRVIAELAAHLRVSGSLSTALAAAGIEAETYEFWVAAIRDGKPDLGAELPLVKLLVATVKTTEAEIKMLREHQLGKLMEENWQALAWWLERKHPEEYGKPVAKPLTPDFDSMLDFKGKKR